MKRRLQDLDQPESELRRSDLLVGELAGLPGNARDLRDEADVTLAQLHPPALGVANVHAQRLRDGLERVAVGRVGHVLAPFLQELDGHLAVDGGDAHVAVREHAETEGGVEELHRLPMLLAHALCGASVPDSKFPLLRNSPVQVSSLACRIHIPVSRTSMRQTNFFL